MLTFLSFNEPVKTDRQGRHTAVPEKIARRLTEALAVKVREAGFVVEQASNEYGGTRVRRTADGPATIIKLTAFFTYGYDGLLTGLDGAATAGRRDYVRRSSARLGRYRISMTITKFATEWRFDFAMNLLGFLKKVKEEVAGEETAAKWRSASDAKSAREQTAVAAYTASIQRLVTPPVQEAELEASEQEDGSFVYALKLTFTTLPTGAMLAPLMAAFPSATVEMPYTIRVLILNGLTDAALREGLARGQD